MGRAVSKAPRRERLWTLWVGVAILLTPTAVNIAIAELARMYQGPRGPWVVKVLSFYHDVRVETTTGLVLLGLALVARGVYRLLARRTPTDPDALTLLHLRGTEAIVPLITPQYLPRPTGPSGTVRFPLLTPR